MFQTFKIMFPNVQRLSSSMFKVSCLCSSYLKIVSVPKKNSKTRVKLVLFNSSFQIFKFQVFKFQITILKISNFQISNLKISDLFELRGSASILGYQKNIKLRRKWSHMRDTGKSSSRKLRQVMYCTLYRMHPQKTH